MIPLYKYTFVDALHVREITEMNPRIYSICIAFLIFLRVSSELPTEYVQYIVVGYAS